jgi:hypothetical protein
MRLIIVFLGCENVDVIIVKYNQQLLLPLLTKTTVLLMHVNVEEVENLQFQGNVDLFFKTTISRDFWWPQMWKVVKDYVTTCDTCSRSKIPRHQPYGLLQPLPIPETPWTSISMDFIVDLPKSKSFDSIFVVVDRLTKMAHFVPCNKTITGKETTRLFLENVYKYHGLPDDIISYRGTQFMSKFW